MKQLCIVVLLSLLSFNSYSIIQAEGEEDGSFGAGNGGDGVIIEIPFYKNNEYMRPDPTWDPDVIIEFDKIFESVPTVINEYGYEEINNDEIPNIFESFLLDFAELGIEQKAKVNLCKYAAPENKLFKQKQSVNVYYRIDSKQYNMSQDFDQRCFVNDYDLFQQLMDYEGFFGEIGNLSLYQFDTNKEMFENTSAELKELSTRIDIAKDIEHKEYDFYNDLREKSNKCNAEKGSDNSDCIILREQQHKQYDKYSTLRKEATDIANRFNEEAFRYYPNITSGSYNARTLIALGIIDKLEQLEKANSDFAQKVKETLLTLEWELLDFPLKEINDEGIIIPTITTKYQIATRHYGIVRITNAGWNKSFEYNGKTVYPLTVENKIGLIFHEVFSQIRQDMGDNTSERARYATTYLFKSNESKRYINKVITLMTKK
jgi:hypothetical protein